MGHEQNAVISEDAAVDRCNETWRQQVEQLLTEIGDFQGSATDLVAKSDLGFLGPREAFRRMEGMIESLRGKAANFRVRADRRCHAILFPPENSEGPA